MHVFAEQKEKKEAGTEAENDLLSCLVRIKGLFTVYEN